MSARRFATTAFVALVLGLAAFGARAQGAWPTRPVRVIVPFAPGGPPDIAARLLGQKLQEKWGQSVVIDNRPGGAGNIGAAAVARAEPDGYTILATSSALPVNVTLFEKPGYSLADFETVAVPVVTPNIVIAAPVVKQKTLADVVRAAKTESFSYASPGIGTTPHLSGELIFRVVNKLDIPHAPFAGAAPAVAAVLAGQLPLGVAALPAALEHVKSGALAGLAVTTPARLPDLPETPTVKETGMGDGDAATAVGFHLPAKTPAAILDKINADINAIVAGGELDKAFKTAGFAAMTPGRAGARAYVEAERDKWAAVIRSANIKPE
jgi:tripartite-type tricarboxylate transporter receptor subunit TctC